MTTVLTTAVVTPGAVAVDLSSPQPPVAHQTPKVDPVHGDCRVDNYFWLREKSNLEVNAYLGQRTLTLTQS
jgi:protease II